MHGAGAHYGAKQTRHKRQFNGLNAAVHDSASQSTTSSSTTSSSTTSSTTSSSSSSSTVSSSTISSTSTTSSTSIISTTTIPSTTSAAPLTKTSAPTLAATRSTTARGSITVPTSVLGTATASATASASSSPPVGTIIGIIGGGLVGVVVLAAVVGYFIRRMNRKSDGFDRGAFVRNSMALQDDSFVEKAPMGTKNALALARANAGLSDEPSATPRPPTMIERRAQAPGFQPGEVIGAPQNAYYADPQAGYYQNYNGGYGNEYAYGQNGQYAGQYSAATVGYTPPSQYQQSELTRKPSAPLGTGRGGYGQEIQSPEDEYHNGNHNGHQSVTPYQQQQYNEISRQLNNPAVALGVPGSEGSNLGRSLSTTYSSLNPQMPAKTYNGAEAGNRSGTPTDHNPQQTYYQPPQGAAAGAEQHNQRASYYDDEDAYGGI